jgi:hypothetical protein
MPLSKLCFTLLELAFCTGIACCCNVERVSTSAWPSVIFIFTRAMGENEDFRADLLGDGVLGELLQKYMKANHCDLKTAIRNHKVAKTTLKTYKHDYFKWARYVSAESRANLRCEPTADGEPRDHVALLKTFIDEKVTNQCKRPLSPCSYRAVRFCAAT